VTLELERPDIEPTYSAMGLGLTVALQWGGVGVNSGVTVHTVQWGYRVLVAGSTSDAIAVIHVIAGVIEP